jgi:hypothetical protein
MKALKIEHQPKAAVGESGGVRPSRVQGRTP